MKILFLSRWLPFPPSNGSKLRIYNLLQGLAKNHEISLITFAAPEEIDPVPPPLADLCADIQIVPWSPFNPQSQKARQGFLSATPRSILDTFSPAISQAISEVLEREAIELVIASQIDMAAYSNQFKGLPAIFEEAELGVIYEQFSRASPLRNKIRSGLTWIKYRRYLNAILPHFNAVTVVSEQEKALFSRAVSQSPQVYVIPNCVNVASYQEIEPDPRPGTMIFTGSLRFPPNYDAMKWFIREVLPIIQREVPGAALSITGDHGDLPLPPGEQITRTGLVPDIRPLVANSWVSVVPIWQGGGTRLKILEFNGHKDPGGGNKQRGGGHQRPTQRRNFDRKFPRKLCNSRDISTD